MHKLLRHSVAFSVALNLLALVPTLYLLQVYDRVLASRSLETLAMLLLAAAIAHAVTLALDAARSALLLQMGQQMDDLLASQTLRAQIGGSLQPARPQNAVSSANLNDVALLRSTLSGPGALAVLDAPWMLVYLAVIFSFHWALGVAALASMVLLTLVAWWNQRDSQQSATAYTTAQVQLDKLTAQIQRNAEVINAFGMAGTVVNRWQQRRAVGVAGQTALSSRNASFKALSKALRQLIQTLMMALGAWLVIQQFATPGIMIATTILLGKALAPAEQLIGVWKSIAELRLAWPRLKALLNWPEPASLQLPKPQGSLYVENLHIAGARQGATPPPLLLHNVTFSLPAGELLAVLGPSGSGKSTLARALLGLLPAASGVVRLDGADIANPLQWPRERLGPYIGYVPQDVSLIMGTVADNIARTLDGAGRNDAAVVLAAQRAGVHDMVLRLPQGYETEIGESGRQLSGGQCQRIALARALYGEPRFVVLDEPNSNLDADGEAALAQVLRLLKNSHVTTVVVTHRPQLVALADQVLLLRGGSVERFGPRAEVEQWLAQQHKAHAATQAQSHANLHAVPNATVPKLQTMPDAAANAAPNADLRSAA